jgi:hypothetical protein
MAVNSRPSLEEFLAAPLEGVAKVAPATMIYSASGTRRHAAFAGVPTQGDDYARWTREQMITSINLIFQHGVRHLFLIAVTPSQFNEMTDNYREHLWRWLDWGLAGPEALADYQRFGWRVRIVLNERLPRLHVAGARLEAMTPEQSRHNLWFFVAPDYQFPWQCMVEAIQRAKEKTQDEVVRVLYGECISSASLYLGTGKPGVSSDQLPPFLIRDRIIQCYWSQRPGYSLDETQLRTILYDYAYLRKTWQKDKTGRAEQALIHREAWEHGPTIGAGMQLGPFWYPAPFALPNLQLQE